MIKTKKEKSKDMNKGITLIALVITIIVLLILAGVSIATLTGENGILTRAQEAKNKTEEAKEDELRRLTSLEAATNVDNTTHTETITQTGTDGTEETKTVTVTIPAGFAVSQVEGENSVEDGLVIIDSQGNEFVWIPVDDINDMVQCSTAGGDCNIELDEETDTISCTTHSNTNLVGKLWATSIGNNFGTENTTYDSNSGLREPAIVTGNSSGTGSNYDGDATNYLNIINEILGTSYSSSSIFLTDMQEDFYDMAKSVAKYHGFYIGRYEMSKSDSNTAQSKPNSVALTADNDNANADKNGNTWYGLYAYGKTYTNTANSVVSSMVWGSQYDAMMRWMQKNGETVTEANDDIKNTESTYTGQEGDIDIIRNVYDLYGGRYEWTLEANDTYVRVYRGGSYNLSLSPSYRYTPYGPNNTSINSSSRLTLYAK